jgi:hypothetical protein
VDSFVVKTLELCCDWLKEELNFAISVARLNNLMTVGQKLDFPLFF